MRVTQALMRAFFVIMDDKLSDGRAEVPFAKEHQTLQALGLDGLDKAFGERIQIRTPRRKDHGRHTAVAEQASKGRAVQRITVDDEVLDTLEEAVGDIGEIAGDLCHPAFVWLAGDPGDLHRARLQLHEEQHEVANQAARGQHFDREEVRGRKALPMRREKRLPRRFRAALRCRLDTVIFENRFDRVAGEVMPEMFQPAADPRVAPGRILVSQADDECGEVRLRGRATRPSGLRAVIFLGNELPIPPQNRVRGDDAGDGHQSAPADELALHREATSLIIGEPKPPWPVLGAKDPILLEQVVNNGLLLSVDPTGEQQADECEWMRQWIHDGKACRRRCHRSTAAGQLLTDADSPEHASSAGRSRSCTFPVIRVRRSIRTRRVHRAEAPRARKVGCQSAAIVVMVESDGLGIEHIPADCHTLATAASR